MVEREAAPAESARNGVTGRLGSPSAGTTTRCLQWLEWGLESLGESLSQRQLRRCPCL